MLLVVGDFGVIWVLSRFVVGATINTFRRVEQVATFVLTEMLPFKKHVRWLQTHLYFFSVFISFISDLKFNVVFL